MPSSKKRGLKGSRTIIKEVRKQFRVEAPARLSLVPKRTAVQIDGNGRTTHGRTDERTDALQNLEASCTKALRGQTRIAEEKRPL